MKYNKKLNVVWSVDIYGLQHSKGTTLSFYEVHEHNGIYRVMYYGSVEVRKCKTLDEAKKYVFDKLWKAGKLRKEYEEEAGKLIK